MLLFGTSMKVSGHTSDFVPFPNDMPNGDECKYLRRGNAPITRWGQEEFQANTVEDLSGDCLNQRKREYWVRDPLMDYLQMQ